MKDFLLKTLAATLDLPTRAAATVARKVSPFMVKNEYVKQVYRKNINLFRIHLAMALLVMLVPALLIFVYALALGSLVALKDFIVEVIDDLSYEYLSIYRPIVRGFKEGLPRD